MYTIKIMHKKNKEENIEEDIIIEPSDEEGKSLSQKDKLKKIREDLKICRNEKEEYLVGWQRSKADYINLQKELGDIRISSSNKTKEEILINLLPVLDSFDMAFTNNKEAWEKVNKEWRIGIEYIYQQFMTALSQSNIYKIDEINVPFNPRIHNSIKIIQTKNKEKDHIIAKIVQTGYKIGDSVDNLKTNKVVRPATVNIYEYKK